MIGAAAPAAGVGAVIVGGVTLVHGALVGGNTLHNIFRKGQDGHPAKDTSTVEGAADQVDDIKANQAEKRRVGLPDAIQETKKSEQALDNALKNIRTSKDVRKP